jgi:nucleotide-binding universal stress UspA family protein
MESAKTLTAFVNLHLWTDLHLRIVTFHDQADIGAERLTAANEYCQAHGLEPETECVPKPPHDAILPYAYDWGADLIVLGNSSKSMLLRRILGETALYVMQHSTVPLFLAQ